MSQHTQWIPVTAQGAEQQPGFRCDGCGQVRWQAEKPVGPCDICPAVADRDPAPSPTIEVSMGSDAPAGSDGISILPPKPPRRSRNPVQEEK